MFSFSVFIFFRMSCLSLSFSYLHMLQLGTTVFSVFLGIPNFPRSMACPGLGHVWPLYSLCTVSLFLYSLSLSGIGIIQVLYQEILLKFLEVLSFLFVWEASTNLLSCSNGKVRPQSIKHQAKFFLEIRY